MANPHTVVDRRHPGLDVLRADGSRISLANAERAWRDVSPITRDSDEQRCAAVASVLDKVNRTLVPTTGASAVSDERDDAHLARSVVGQLAKSVQRAERRLAERRTATASRMSDHVPRRPDDRSPPHDEWIPVEDVVDTKLPSSGLPPYTGIRGLASRPLESPRSTRAALFGLIPNTRADWPSSELDQLSSALDDAARRDGVELGELDT